MAKPQVPTGRPKRFRIRLVCHTGIDPVRQFWEYFSGLRRDLRQEYLRRCLLLGFRFGKTGEVAWPEPASGGKAKKVEVLILGDDLDLRPFLSKYESMGFLELRTLWVLRMCLAGHDMLRGSLKGRGGSPDDLSVKEEISGTAFRPDPSEKLRGLFQ